MQSPLSPSRMVVHNAWNRNGPNSVMQRNLFAPSNKRNNLHTLFACASVIPCGCVTCIRSARECLAFHIRVSLRPESIGLNVGSQVEAWKSMTGDRSITPNRGGASRCSALMFICPTFQQQALGQWKCFSGMNTEAGNPMLLIDATTVERKACMFCSLSLAISRVCRRDGGARQRCARWGFLRGRVGDLEGSWSFVVTTWNSKAIWSDMVKSQEFRSIDWAPFPNIMRHTRHGRIILS